jgi:hypothetical protein
MINVTTVNTLFHKVGLTPSEPIRWGQPIPEIGNGVYVVSLSSNNSKNDGLLPTCEIKEEVFSKWRSLSPELNINGKLTKQVIELELNKYWRPKESILYIGESTSKTNGLTKRVNQFYIHQVGWKGPHTGGYWLKLLSNLENLFVYYAVCKNPRDTEFKMLMHFIEQTSGKSFYDLDELGKYLPFANLKVDFQKKHNISKAVSKKRI